MAAKTKPADSDTRSGFNGQAVDSTTSERWLPAAANKVRRRIQQNISDSPSAASSIPPSGASTPVRSPLLAAQKQRIAAASPFNILLNDGGYLSDDLTSTPSKKKRGSKTSVIEQSPMNNTPKSTTKSSKNKKNSNLSGVKAVLNFEEIPNAISVKRFEELYEEFKTRYPKRPDIQLQAILEHTEHTLIDLNWSFPSFASKQFSLEPVWIDGKLGDFPKDCLKWLENILDCYEPNQLQNLFNSAVVALLEEVKKSSSGDLHSSFGFQIIIQIIMRKLRFAVDLSNLSKAIRKRFSNFQANPAVAHSLLWVLLQKPAVDDFPVWFEYFLPCFGPLATSTAASVQSLALDYAEVLIKTAYRVDGKAGDKLFLDPQYIEPLLITAYASDGLISLHKKARDYVPRLQRLFGFIEENVFSAESPLRTNKHEVFEIILPHASSSDSHLSLEVHRFLIRLLNDDHACFKTWMSAYESNVNETALVLKYCLEKITRDILKIDKKEFSDFLHKLIVAGDQLLSRPGWGTGRVQKYGASKSSVSECNETAKQLLGLLEKRRKPSVGVFSLLFTTLAMILLAWIVICKLDAYPPLGSTCSAVNTKFSALRSEPHLQPAFQFIESLQIKRKIDALNAWLIEQRPLIDELLVELNKWMTVLWGIFLELFERLVNSDIYKNTTKLINELIRK